MCAESRGKIEKETGMKSSGSPHETREQTGPHQAEEAKSGDRRHMSHGRLRTASVLRRGFRRFRTARKPTIGATVVVTSDNATVGSTVAATATTKERTNEGNRGEEVTGLKTNPLSPIAGREASKNSSRSTY